MSCDQLHPFVDGELGEGDAEAYRRHLAGCGRCQAELPRVMGLVGLLEEHREAPRRDARRSGGQVVPLRPRRTRFLAFAALAAVAAAGLVWWAWPPARDRATRAPTVAWQPPRDGARPSVARLAYAGAQDYRPYAPVRGGGDDAAPITLAELAKLEARDDWHGVAVASWWRGDRDAAARALARAGTSDDVMVDRAALALDGDDPIALAAAQDALDRVLAARPTHAAARWNRAQVLARMGLRHSAAAAFAQIAAAGEPGWSDEAARTASDLTAAASAEASDWQAAWDQGRVMIADGTPIAARLVATRPGIARLMFYDAVRAAPDAARVRALAPLAEQLDAHSGGRHLAALLERVAASDFTRRAPLASRFRALVTAGGLQPNDAAEFVRALDRAGPDVDDLRLGAWFHLGLIETRAADYDRMVAAGGDPWFIALAAHRRAMSLRAGGDRDGAVRALVAALSTARAAQVHYRAALIELDLAQLYLELDRLPEAAELARSALARARAGGEAGHAAAALPVLGAVALYRGQRAAARAYYDEWLQTQPDDCAVVRHGATMLAEVALLERQHGVAREQLARARRCSASDDPQLTLAQLAIDVGLWRHGGTEDDAAHIDHALAELRARPGLSNGQRAMIDALGGALANARDPQAGHEALRAAIDATSRTDADSLTRRARNWATALLAIAATRRDDGAAVVRLLAEARGMAVPSRCTLAIALDDERWAAAALDRDGRASVQLELRWPFPNAAPPPGDPWMPAALRDRLAGCDEVGVLALAPIEGAAQLLPADLAWSYLVGPLPAQPIAAPRVRLHVSGVVAPDRLALPALPLPPPIADPERRELRGASATPSRVLAEMRDATEIELHTHGVADRARSDASYLVLSPDDDGDYALTAARVAAATLRGAPIVTLAACRSARNDPYLHESHSLPQAFRLAGARAVLAVSSDIPDDEAARFFAAVRARTAGGAALAVALRDERRDWLRRDPTSWTREVLLFQ